MKTNVAEAFDELSHQRRRLLRLLQQINHGRIHGLRIRDGQPVLDPMPQVVRTVKFPGENGPRAEIGIGDYALKAPVRHFFDYLDFVQNGVIEVLEVRDGLPVAGEVEETLHLN